MLGLGKDRVQDKDNRSVQLIFGYFGRMADHFAREANPARCESSARHL